jgi:hypothetical protein
MEFATQTPYQKSRFCGFFDHTPKATDSENFHFPKIQKKRLFVEITAQSR